MNSVPFVYVLGLEHKVQHFHILNSPEIEKFGAKVDELVAVHDFDLYFEEALHGSTSLLERHAESVGKKYFNIEMTPEERDSNGIPSAYRQHLDRYSEEECMKWDQLREQYMADQIERLSFKGSKSLFLCGDAHREPIIALCRAKGFRADGKNGIEPTP